MNIISKLNTKVFGLALALFSILILIANYSSFLLDHITEKISPEITDKAIEDFCQTITSLSTEEDDTNSQIAKLQDLCDDNPEGDKKLFVETLVKSVATSYLDNNHVTSWLLIACSLGTVLGSIFC